MADTTLTNNSARILWIQGASALLKFDPLSTVAIPAADLDRVNATLAGPFKWYVDIGEITLTVPEPPPPEGGALRAPTPKTVSKA